MAEMDPNVRDVCLAEGVDPHFVGFLAESLRRAAPGQRGVRRVRPAMLCESLRDLALDRFGGLALYVLESWGIRSTRDVGDVIARLHKHKIFMFSEGEGVADFEGVLDLQQELSVERALRRGPDL